MAVLVTGAAGFIGSHTARALLERETLDELEIIRVTGITPAPANPESPLSVPTAAAAVTAR